MPTYPGCSDGALSGTAEIVIVDSPAAGYRRLVKNITIGNFISGVDLQLRYKNGSATRIFPFTVVSGDIMVWGEEDFFVLDSTSKKLAGRLSLNLNPDFIASWVDII